VDIRDIPLADDELVGRFYDVGGNYFAVNRSAYFPRAAFFSDVFYRMFDNVFCVLIVYDISNHESFDNAVLKCGCFV